MMARPDSRAARLSPITPERWQRIADVFLEVADASEKERGDALERACGGDAGLREQVETLLAADAGNDAITAVLRTQAAKFFEGHLASRRLGAYSLVREVGRGGMGAVYLAIRADDAFRKEVAIKVLPRGLGTEAIRRFRRERQILAGLVHPNIAGLLDGGSTDDGLPYLVMEYVQGRPLREYAKSLDIENKLRLFLDVAGAVEYAHEHLVVHRDLKPANILVTSDGRPKLLDFGIAKLLADPLADPDDVQTVQPDAATKTVAFTPGYASPEQVRGEPATVAVDVYALGAILYELLSGVQAQVLQSTELSELLRVVCEEMPPLPSTVAPPSSRRTLRGDLDTIVLKALQKEPARRYRSVAAFSEDVRRYLSRRAVVARKDSALYTLGKFVRRNRVAVAAATVVILGLSTALLVSIREARRAERRYEDVRALTKSFLFEVHDQLVTIPGTTAVRELVVRRAQEYLDKVAAEETRDPALLLDLAAAYIKLGDAQGSSWGPNLGRTEDALRSYDHARALLARAHVQSPAASALLAQAETNEGAVFMDIARYDEAHERLVRAIDAARPLRSTNSPDRFLEVRAWLGLEMLGLRRSLRDEEVSAGRGAVAAALARMPRGQNDPEALYWVACAKGTLARGVDLAESITLFEEALDALEGATTLAPNDLRFQREAVVTRALFATGLGNPFGVNAHDPVKAHAVLAPAIPLAEALQAADPRNLRAAHDLAVALAVEADITAGPDPNEALGFYDRGIAALSERTEVLDANVAGDLAMVRGRSVHTLVRLGRADEAVVRAAKAVDEVRALIGTTDDPLRAGYAFQLSEELRLLGEAEQAAGHGDLSDHALDEAVLVAARGHEAQPKNPDALVSLAAAHEWRGDALAARTVVEKNDRARSELATRATEAYQASLALWRAWTGVAEDGAFNRIEEARVEAARDAVAGRR
jgi:tetratricopeptide (TPR) repeat protein